MIPISVAPMMGRTDRHCRFFHRLVSPSARLYTVMLTTGALIHGDARDLLGFGAAEHPVALQLGGSDPADLVRAAKMGADAGYDEINLNCGCPSDRVQRGRFGACLMLEPAYTAACVAAMVRAVDVPVTVKCRTSVDDQDDFAFLLRFARAVRDAGAAELIVHARKCWLRGLSPKENRDRPPLDYARVHALKAQYFPGWPIWINGGFTAAGAVRAQAGAVDGVMIGRAAVSDPWLLHDLDPAASRTRPEVAQEMAAYIAQQKDIAPRAITRHMAGLMKGRPGASQWRQAMAAGDLKRGLSIVDSV